MGCLKNGGTRWQQDTLLHMHFLIYVRIVLMVEKYTKTHFTSSQCCYD